jgi:hypothetical protein
MWVLLFIHINIHLCLQLQRSNSAKSEGHSEGILQHYQWNVGCVPGSKCCNGCSSVAKLETDRNGVPSTWCSGHSKYTIQCIYHQKSLIITLLLIFTLFFASILTNIERILEMQCTDMCRAISRERKSHFGPIFNTSYKVYIQKVQ